MLSNCTLSNTDTLLQLTAVTGLTCLLLHSVQLQDSGNDVPDSVDPVPLRVRELSAAVSALLQHLTHLERLKLESINLDNSAFRHLSGLQRLQCAEINISGRYFSLDALAGLPSSLTSLFIRSGGSRSRFPKRLLQLTNLRSLFLADTLFYPAVLSSMVQLRDVDIQECRMLPDAGQPMTAAEREAAATADLLAAVGQLSQLQDLSVMRSCSTQGVPARAFAALTASSQLTSLSIICEDELPLVAGAVQHMFPADRQMPALQSLYLRADVIDQHDLSYADEPDTWCVSTSDLSSITRSCPALQELGLCCVLQPGDVSALLELPAQLSSLHVGGGAFDDAAVAVVTQSSALQRLSWEHAPGFTDVGLEQLTALRQLEHLHASNNPDVSKEVVPTNWYGIEELELSTGVQVS